MITKSENKKMFTIRPACRTALFIFVPILFGLFPIIFLYARNIQEVPSSLLVGPVLAIVITCLIITPTLKILVKDWYKASLITAAFWIFFFFYGPIFTYVEKFLPESLGRHRYLLLLWAFILAAISSLIWRSKNINKKLLQSAAAVGLILVIMQLASIIRYSAAPPKTNSYDYLVNQEQQVFSGDRSRLPDIYYIMPDGYPRSDTLKNYFNFDNADFDNFLESQGFYIASKSHSNYNQTGLAVPSVMNMSYLVDLRTKSLETASLINLYQHNKVLEYVKSAGYRFVNNSNLYSTKFNDAADFNIDCGKTNEFMNELVANTALKPFKLVIEKTRKNLRGDALCVMDNIDGVGKSPKFVFTHLLPPHPPYIFGANGEDIEEVNLSLTVSDRWLATKPYISQLRYVNKRITEAIDQILNDDPDSIVIVQSDHGTLVNATETQDPLRDTRAVVLRERSQNYTAIHLPDFCDKSKLYESITNVNTFRLIFNSCFGADYEILQDKIYYVKPGPGRFFDYQDITDLVTD